jgi:hypothetical protein
MMGLLWLPISLCAQAPFKTTVTSLSAYFTPKQLTQLKSGDFVVGGQLPDARAAVGAASTDGFLLRVDALGTPRHLRPLGTDGLDMWAGVAAGPNQTTWCALGSDKVNHDRNTANHGNRDAWLVQLDEAGNPVQQLAYGTDGEDTPLYLGNLPSGNLLLICWVEYGTGHSTVMDALPGSLWASELSATDGSLVRQKVLPFEIPFALHTFYPTPALVAPIGEKGEVLLAWRSFDKAAAGAKRYTNNVCVLDPNTWALKQLTLNTVVPDDHLLVAAHPGSGVAMALPQNMEANTALQAYLIDPAKGRKLAEVRDLVPLTKAKVTPLADGSFLYWGQPIAGHTGAKPRPPMLALNAAGTLEPSKTPPPAGAQPIDCYRYSPKGDFIASCSFTIPAGEQLVDMLHTAGGQLLMLRMVPAGTAGETSNLGRLHLQLKLMPLPESLQ